VKTVFVDTSAFYALLDGSDPFCPTATQSFRRAESERWQLVTTNYVVHETWALVQHRLGWSALEDFWMSCCHYAGSSLRMKHSTQQAYNAAAKPACAI
jgi:predicted nucleic acid-binding protein